MSSLCVYISELYQHSQAGSVADAATAINNGADVHWENAEDDNSTALWVASCNGHLAVAEMLVAAGANVNHKDSYNITALTGASYNGHLAVVKLLVENGADISIKTYEGRALELAMLRNKVAVADYLRSRGAH